MANLFHSRGFVGLTLLFCSSASLFLGILGICLVRIWSNSPWESPPLWSGVTGLLTGLLGIACTRLNSVRLDRTFIFSSVITTMTTCSGLGVLIVQLSLVSRTCENAQVVNDTDCSRKLVVLSGFIFFAMILILLSSLVGVSFWGRRNPKGKTIRAPEQGIVLVSTPHSETHQTLVPVKCQYIAKPSGRDSLVLAPWTLPSSTPGYSNRLSNAFNISFSAGGSSFENGQSRYVPLD